MKTNCSDSLFLVSVISFFQDIQEAVAQFFWFEQFDRIHILLGEEDGAGVSRFDVDEECAVGL